MDSIDNNGVDPSFEEDIDQVGARSRKKTKADVLFDILNLEPLLIGTIAKAMADGKSTQNIRQAFIERLEKNPEIIEKHGGDFPMKIWHPEFLTATRAVLEVRLPSMSDGEVKNRFASALSKMDLASERALVLKETARKNKETASAKKSRKKSEPR